MDKKSVRKIIDTKIITLMDAADPTGANTSHYLSKVGKMTDDQFFDYITKLFESKHGHLYIEYAKQTPNRDQAMKVAEAVGCEPYEYVVRPDLSSDPNNPVVTVNKCLVGPALNRKLSQDIQKKNTIPTDSFQRNAKSGAVVGKSKGMQLSDNDLYALTVQGLTNTIREDMYFRAGDDVARNQLLHQIAETGRATISDKKVDPENDKALQTTNVFFLGAAIETDLMSRKNNLILPRTIHNPESKMAGLTRK